jgi:hypothetical protein
MEKMPVSSCYSICVSRKLNFTDKTSSKAGEICPFMMQVNIISDFSCPDNTR